MSDGGERIRHTREQEMDRINSGRVGGLSSPFQSSVVGVTFVEGYPQNLYDLEMLSLGAESQGERLAAIIVRRPDNPYDANACEVHVPALGGNGMIGHLPRPVAARLAAELDAGTVWQAEVAYVRVSPENPSNPGITIALNRRTAS